MKSISKLFRRKDREPKQTRTSLQDISSALTDERKIDSTANDNAPENEWFDIEDQIRSRSFAARSKAELEQMAQFKDMIS